MGYSGERYSAIKLPEQSLAVIECGITINEPENYVAPRVYPHHAIHFVINGKGTYVVNEKSYAISKGQGFLITPNVVNSYIADSADPWKYIYVVFSGNDAEAISNNAGLDETNVVFNFDTSINFINLLYSIHTACSEQSSLGYKANGYFILAMSELIEKNLPERKEASSASQYIQKAKLYIEQHFSYRISIQDLAAHVGLERSYLYRIFKDKYNKSPSEYINDYRLKKSVEMMNNYSLTLPSIAMSTGFYDYSYFSKQFIKKYDMTPGEYRKKLNTKER